MHDNPTLDELSDRYQFSTRTLNRCLAYELTTLSSILEFYIRHGSFLVMRDCGKKTNGELLEVVLHHMPSLAETAAPPQHVQLHELNTRKQVLCTVYVQQLMQTLTPAACKVLQRIEACDTRALLKRIFAPDFSFTTLPKSKAGTAHELNEFKRQVFDYMLSLHQSPDEHYTLEQMALLIGSELELPLSRNDLVIHGVLNAENHIQLMCLVQVWQLRGLRTNRERNVAKALFYQDGSRFNLAALARSEGLTREGIRQIQLRLETRLIAFVQRIHECCKRYGLILAVPHLHKTQWLVIDSAFAQTQNLHQGVNYNAYAYTLVWTSLFTKTHRALPYYYHIRTKKSNSYHKRVYLKNGYLIPVSLSLVFNSGDFLKALYACTTSQRATSATIQFEAFVAHYCSTKNPDRIKALLAFCERLLNNEFDLTPAANGELVLARTTPKRLDEYIEEILLRYKQPVHITTITQEVRRLSNNRFSAVTSIRAALSCASDRYISIGRTSTYLWHKYLDKRNQMQRKTIKAIGYALLHKSRTPLHLEKLTQAIGRYRKTTVKSLYTQFLNDQQKRFVFYNNQHVGLSQKKYAAKWEVQKPRPHKINDSQNSFNPA